MKTDAKSLPNLKEAAKSFSYPIDGVVFKYNDINEKKYQHYFDV